MESSVSSVSWRGTVAVLRNSGGRPGSALLYHAQPAFQSLDPGRRPRRFGLPGGRGGGPTAGQALPRFALARLELRVARLGAPESLIRGERFLEMALLEVRVREDPPLGFGGRQRLRTDLLLQPPDDLLDGAVAGQGVVELVFPDRLALLAAGEM